MKQKNTFTRTKDFIKRVMKISKRKGISHVFYCGRLIYNNTKDFFEFYFYRIFYSSRTFVFRVKQYKYFYHKYNTTWKLERTVEVPIIFEVVKKHHDKNILEVGNVLSHYFPVNHDIIDKYEKGKGVINEDVVDFRPPKKYDLIVSISTLEHVGGMKNRGNLRNS